jgi:hypothetical protein
MFISFLLSKALPLILKVIVGPITYHLGRVLLNAWRAIDDLNPAAKRFAVFVIALGISAALHATGQQVPAECSALSSGAIDDACASVLSGPGFLSALVTAVLGSGIAFLLHAEKKADPA